MNAFADNPLQTREDIARAVSQLVEPLETHRSPGGARLKPSAGGAWFPDIAADLEGFARPLWGLAPLAAGASSATGEDEYDGWDRIREGLRNGTDPDHPEHWGPAGDNSQKHVETAAIGFSLALAPERIWDPLEPATQEQVATYLRQIDDATCTTATGCSFACSSISGSRTSARPTTATCLERRSTASSRSRRRTAGTPTGRRLRARAITTFRGRCTPTDCSTRRWPKTMIPSGPRAFASGPSSSRRSFATGSVRTVRPCPTAGA